MKRVIRFLITLVLLHLGTRNLAMAQIGALPRVSNNSINLPTEPPATTFQVVPAFPGVTLTRPVCFASPPGDAQRLFICEFGGKIKVVPDVTAASLSSSLVIDLRQVITQPPRTPAESWYAGPDEGAGLAGMAFHPNYTTNGYFYVSYMVVKSSDPGVWYQRLSRFTVPAPQIAQAAPVASPSSELILIEQRDRHHYHNGSDLHFGQDGYLYWSIGDEGNRDDSFGNAQRIDLNFFSALLRIDVDKKPGNLEPNAHPNPAVIGLGYSPVNAVLRDETPAGSGIFKARYSIPIDNPFVTVAQGGTWNGIFNGSTISAGNSPYVRSEFWAVGLRSPWRFSIDAPTGEILLGDIGQEGYEELNKVTKGANFGWPHYEGNHPGPKALPPGFTSVAPFHEYPSSALPGDPNYKGNCIIGGVSYRGSRFEGLSGSYIFGDFTAGHIWALTRPGGVASIRRIAGLAGLTAFGTDPSNGDVLIADYFGGRVMRLVTTTATNNFPATLSATGLFSKTGDLTPTPGLLPYTPNLSFWSDYAVKRRWFIIPDATRRMTWSRDGAWTFPNGQIWVKHFDLESERGNSASPKKRLETRVLVKNSAGVYGVSYRWNAAGTDATLVGDGGEDFSVAIIVNGAPYTQQWSVPSRAQCNSCHSPQAGYALSFNTRQLNLENTINGVTGNLVDLLWGNGYFSNTPESSALLPRLYQHTETSISAEERARSYLAVNCAYCHAGATGTAPAGWDVRPHIPLAQTGLINGPTSQAPAPYKRIVPGDPARSVILQRIGASGGFSRMPPLATHEIDPEGIALITTWIQDLGQITNRPPLARTDFHSTTSGTTLAVPAPGVLANDTDPDAFPLTAAVHSSPSHGSLTLNSNGGFSYTPTPGYAGVDSFTYHASDGDLNSNVVKVIIPIYQETPAGLVNGSFENAFDGWTVNGNLSITTATAPDGLKYVSLNDVNRTPNGVLSQSFTTIPGREYRLRFKMGVLAYNSAEQRLRVELTGINPPVTYTYSMFGMGGGSIQWQQQELSFTASEPSTRLTFRDQSPSTSSLDLLLDHVLVTHQTLPPNPAGNEFLPFVPTALRTADSIRIEMPAVEPGRYELLRSSDLKVWQHVGEIITSAPVSLEFDDTETSESRMFYRILLHRGG